MRIGLIIYGSLETISGGYLYDRMLVEHLRAAGDEVEIIALPRRDYTRHLTDNSSSQLYDRLREARFDILLQDELNHPSLWGINRRLRGKISFPIVSIVHHLRSSEQEHLAALRPLYRMIERRYLRSVDGFIFNSQTTQAAVYGLAGEEKPGMVSNPAADHLGAGLAADAIRSRVERGGPYGIVFLGNLIARKGPHTLLDAVAQHTSDDWYLTVIGSTSANPRYAARIRSQIEALGLAAHVSILDAVTDESLILTLSNSTVIVVPSTYEGYGIAYLEGMAFGLPAIGTTGGAAGEIITPAENGFLITPGDADDLATCLRMLFDDHERLLRMSLAARQRYERQPTWAESAAGIRVFMERMASGV